MTRFSRSDLRNDTSSSMIFGIVSASDRIAPVHGLHPSERMRHRTICGFSPGNMRDKRLLQHDQRLAAHQHLALLGVIHGNDGDLLGVDVLPDVHLGPIGKRKDAQALARMNARVKQIPQFGPLVLGIPLALFVAERKDALLGARFLLVAPCAADGRVETALPQAVEKSLCLQQAAAALGAQPERVRAIVDGFAIGVDDQLCADFGGVAIAKFDHLAKLVGGVDVQQREGDRRRVESLLGQPQQDRGILADGVEHHRTLELRRDLAHDMDAFGFEQPKMAKLRHHEQCNKAIYLKSIGMETLSCKSFIL